MISQNKQSPLSTAVGNSDVTIITIYIYIYASTSSYKLTCLTAYVTDLDYLSTVTLMTKAGAQGERILSFCVSHMQAKSWNDFYPSSSDFSMSLEAIVLFVSLQQVVRDVYFVFMK